MSVVYTADVFCDGEDCSQWVHGITQSLKPPTQGLARIKVANINQWKRINGKDYCPRCAKKMTTGGNDE